MDTYYAQPPVIRTLTAAVVITSVSVYVNTTLFSYAWFDLQSILKFPPEIWRLVTAFLITGPKLYILMDPYFLFTYGKGLETGSPRFRRTGDFVWYICFVMIVIAVLAGGILAAPMFNEALMLAFVHTFAQDNPRAKVGFVIIEIEARFLPFALIFLNFVTRGPPSAMVGATGIIASHTYDFLTRIWPTFGGGQNWIPTPPLIQRLFGDDRGGVRHKAYGEAHYRSSAQAGESSGRSSGVSTSFTGRGPGRRLGS